MKDDQPRLGREQWEQLDTYKRLRVYSRNIADVEARLVLARRKQAAMIKALRDTGVPWQGIAEALGLRSKQAAWNLYDRATRRAPDVERHGQV